MKKAALFFPLLCAIGAAHAEPGVSESKVLIGQSIGLSGPVAAVAQDIRSGLAAYVHHVNKRGGIHGRLLELRVLDDGFVPQRSAANAKVLATETFLLAAPLGTPHTAELMQSSGGAPLLCPFTGAERLRAPNRTLFHIRAGYRDEIEKMAGLLTSVGIDRIALFYQNDSFGEEGLEHLQAALAARKLKLAAKASYERGGIEIDAAVKAIAAADPQAVILFSVTRAGAEMVRRLQAAGKYLQFLSISLNGNDDFVAALGAHKRGVGNTQVAPFPWNLGLPLVKEYQQAMRETGHQRFSFNSAEGFLCGKVIGEGMRRASRNLTRAGFIEALEGLRSYDAGGYEIGFTAANHVGSRAVDLTVIDADGRFLR